MEKNCLILITVFFLVPVSAGAWTLEEIISEVMARHPAIEEAQWDAESARAERRAGSWLADPKVKIEFEEVPLSGKSPGNADMTNYSVSQEIPFPGSLATKSKSLNAEYKARKAMLTGAEREVTFEAKKTFFELAAVQNQLKDKKSIVSFYRQAISALEKQYATGSSVQTSGMKESPFADLLMAKMKKAETETEILDLNHQREAAMAKLNLFMGRDAHAPLPITEIPKTKKLKTDISVLEEKLLSGNSDLSALKWLAEKSKKEASLARQKLIPTVEPEFAYNRRQNRENAYTLGLSFNIPLWLNRNAAEIKASRADYFRSRSEYENERLDLKSELHDIYHHHIEHQKIIEKYRSEILPYARSSAEASLVAFGANLASSTGLLQKLTVYHEASRMYWDMWKDYQIEYALLEQLVGEKL